MSVDELSRSRLAQRAVEVFGEAEAATLMDHLPIGGVSNLATKDDMRILGAELRLEMSELRTDLRLEMSELRTELRGEMSELRADFGTLRGEFGTLRGEFGELKGEFGELKGEFGALRGDFGQLRADIEERLNRQTITLITTMTGIFGLMLAIFKWA